MTNPNIIYLPNGNTKIELYYLYNKLHRDPLEGPALIYYEYKQIIKKVYYINGKLHNPYEPAIINYKHDIYDWHLNDKEYTKKVNEYLNKNNLNYKTMTQTDFNIMWTMIL